MRVRVSTPSPSRKAGSPGRAGLPAAASACTKGFGPWLLYTWSRYTISQDPNVAYAAQSDTTLNRMLMIYTIIPAIFVVLQMVPIFFYDNVGKKKEMITQALKERRAAAAAENGEGSEPLAEAE